MNDTTKQLTESEKQLRDTINSIALKLGDQYESFLCDHCRYELEDHESEELGEHLSNGEFYECPSCGQQDTSDHVLFRTLDGYSYLEDALDIEYIISSNGECLGGRILVAFGGPNIWVNTRTNTIEGYWWGDSYHKRFTDEIGVHAALVDLWECR